MPKNAIDAKPKSKKKKKSKKRKSKNTVPLTLVVCNIQIYDADGALVDEAMKMIPASKIAQSDVPNNMLALLSALRASTSGVS